jgi:hypothetical protein
VKRFEAQLILDFNWQFRAQQAENQPAPRREMQSTVG